MIRFLLLTQNPLFPISFCLTHLHSLYHNLPFSPMVVLPFRQTGMLFFNKTGYFYNTIL